MSDCQFLEFKLFLKILIIYTQCLLGYVLIFQGSPNKCVDVFHLVLFYGFSTIYDWNVVQQFMQEIVLTTNIGELDN